jgi:N,N-dimethylformamidase beta subunit-like, C-terminal
MRTWVAAALLAVLAAPPVARGQTNPIQLENARAGTAGWNEIGETTSIEGYADRTSIAPGETLGLHVASSVPGSRYRIELYRLGWYGGVGARKVPCVPCELEHAASAPPAPSYDPATGELRANWPLGQSIAAEQDWISGYYEARLILTTGDEAGRAYRLWFVVREPTPNASALVVQAPVNTWQAYNNWGGRSLYDFNSAGARANRVSFDRPYAVRVPGAQATPLVWEYQLVRFLEAGGYDVSYQTDVDTDRDPGSLLRHRLVLTTGHSEYWTKEMRDAFERARDQGTNLAFVGANNAYWQVRYENDRRTMVGYKSTVDPAAPELKTIRFRDLPTPRPECQLVGVQFPEEGLFSRGDFFGEPSALADPWFAGTGIVAGAPFRFLVSDEHDWLPGPAPAGCGQPGLRVLFRYDGSPPAHAVRYVAGSGARVFASGTMQFAWGLDAFGAEQFGYIGPEQRLQQFMRNALADLVRPAAPAPLTARVTAPGTVTVSAPARPPDPRVEIAVVRHEGGAFADDPANLIVCRALPCVDRVRGHRTYAYAATAVDRWGSSERVASGPVAVPNSRPRAGIAGPRVVRRGARAVYRATVSDVDGDTLRLEWRLDARRLPGSSRSIAIRIRTAGRHRVSVTVRDGHGGVAAAVLPVRVR